MHRRGASTCMSQGGFTVEGFVHIRGLNVLKEVIDLIMIPRIREKG